MVVPADALAVSTTALAALLTPATMRRSACKRHWRRALPVAEKVGAAGSTMRVLEMAGEPLPEVVTRGRIDHRTRARKR